MNKILVPKINAGTNLMEKNLQQTATVDAVEMSYLAKLLELMPSDEL